MTRNIGGAKPRLEAAALIKAMHPWVFAAALKQDMMTVLGPSCSKCSSNDGSPVSLTPKFGMRHNVFEEPVPLPCAQ